MKTVAVVVFVIAGLAVTANAALSFEKTKEDYKGPGFCYTDKLGEFKENEEKQIKEYCGIATCGKERIITYASCGAVSVEPPYKLVEDKTKPYPKCCPTPVRE